MTAAGVAAVQLAPHRLLLVDSQTVFVQSLAERFAAEDDLVIVAALTRPGPALAMAHTETPDVIVLGRWVDGVDGVVLAERLHRQSGHTRILMMADAGDDAQVVINALRAGAAGYVTTDVSVDVLLQAVRGVLRGELWLAPRVVGPVIDLLMNRTPGAEQRLLLTRRERDVLRCLVEGLDQATIASRLFVSVNTVRTHRRRVLAKLGAHSSLEAVAVARSWGLLSDS